MGLVDYSDSEGSDADTAAPALKPAPARATCPNVVDRAGAKKIKVDLPAIQPEPGQQDEAEQRPAKRAKTSGAFSGFNSMLPAPKGRVQSGPKPGVNLKTSSEAAFSRAPVDHGNEVEVSADAASMGGDMAAAGKQEEGGEPKMVGKATKFRPLSVANKKKPVKKARPQAESKPNGHAAEAAKAAKSSAPASDSPSHAPAAAAPSAPKPKRSLFSMQAEEDSAAGSKMGATYESLISNETLNADLEPSPAPQSQPPSDPNSLHSVASDLNLTPAQRRQLFGRNAKSADINIAHFNMDSEYAANEQARQAGDVVEHRAVKAIAPGKHSLQQLVNNARTQQGAMEDKWAEGRRERGEAGGKYGWGK